MTEYELQLFDLMFLLNNNKIKDIEQLNRLGSLIISSNNYSYAENFLANVSWKEIDETILIQLISKIAEKANRFTMVSIIKKLYIIQKYDIIEKFYHMIKCNNETVDEAIVDNARSFIVSNYQSEDIYDEFLDAKVFLGLLCDKKANQDNLQRSFELVKHIKPKKICKNV